MLFNQSKSKQSNSICCLINVICYNPQAASSAGEPLTPAVSNWFEREFGVPILDHYGQATLMNS